MTLQQYLERTLPLHVCEICGAAGKSNPDCTACRKSDKQLERDRLSDLFLEVQEEREEMNYVGEFDSENY